MSQKYGIRRKGRAIFSLTALLWFSLMGCDPCYQLAEKLCNCRESDEEKRACINALSLASDHNYFKKAKTPEICEEALKNCSCPDFNNNNDEKCGMYRNETMSRVDDK